MVWSKAAHDTKLSSLRIVALGDPGPPGENSELYLELLFPVAPLPVLILGETDR